MLTSPLDVVPATRQQRILVVDDEIPITELIAGYLRREGWLVETAHDGERALEAVRETSPDVVVLDLMLPGLDGLEVCRRLRTFSDTYVLMLTARTDEMDRIVGLSVGADDYLGKPFSPREVVARIKALLRRQRTGIPARRLPDGLEVDEARHVVRVDGEAVHLTPLEFAVVAVLAREPGVVAPRTRLFDEIWGEGFVADNHLVDVHVANLRRKLGDDPERPRFVQTVRGVGYRLRDPGN